MPLSFMSLLNKISTTLSTLTRCDAISSIIRNKCFRVHIQSSSLRRNVIVDICFIVWSKMYFTFGNSNYSSLRCFNTKDVLNFTRQSTKPAATLLLILHHVVMSHRLFFLLKVNINVKIVHFVFVQI